MGDANPIRTLRDYSKPSHEGYKNTIKLPSEDPNQDLKDFLKLVDSLNLDGANRERTRLSFFEFSLRDQVSNWLERLPARLICTGNAKIAGKQSKPDKHGHKNGIECAKAGRMLS
ncbi:hypothetical protein Tco_0032595, partial [Tanacetum coccineum]